MLKYYFFQSIFLIFSFFRKTYRLSSLYVAKKNGLKIGDETLLIGTQDFGSEPFLVEIGEKRLITNGVQFITHDGSIQVPLIEKGESVAEVYSKKSTFGKIMVGNNVFIGISTILLPNTEIGDNSIIAAGSVVKGKFPEGVVLGGSPAKIICTINEYYNKNHHHIISFSKNANRRNIIISSMRDI